MNLMTKSAFLGSNLIAIGAATLGITAPASAVTFSNNPEFDLANAGVNPGDQFRIVFVTTGVRSAVIPNISDYNSFVDSDADNLTFNSAMDSLLGSVIQDDFSGNAANIDYNAIGSTSSVDARDNTNTNPNTDGVGEPILLVDGAIVANDYNDLWDGNIDNLIDVNSNDQSSATFLWTGTDDSGKEVGGNGLGPGSSGEAYVGASLAGSESDEDWVAVRPLGVLSRNRPLYGMSEPLTRAQLNQPTAVPFHTDTLPGLIAMGGLIFWRYRRQKRKAD